MSNDINAMKLSVSSTVNDALRLYPESISILNALGIDTCCGGGETLGAAARDAGIEPEALVAALDFAAAPSSCEIDR